MLLLPVQVQPFENLCSIVLEALNFLNCLYLSFLLELRGELNNLVYAEYLNGA